jgi:hypothetical protein
VVAVIVVVQVPHVYKEEPSCMVHISHRYIYVMCMHVLMHLFAQAIAWVYAQAFFFSVEDQRSGAEQSNAKGAEQADDLS